MSSPGYLTAIPSAIVGPKRARLDADEARVRPQRAQRDRDPGGEAAAADRQHERLDVGQLLRELEPDRPLAGDHVAVLERVDERRTGAARVLEAPRPAPRRTPPRRGRSRRRTTGVASTLAIGASSGMKTVAVIPSSRAARATACPWLPALAATTPAARWLVVEQRELVRRAADLERPRALQVLGLEPDLTAGARRERVGAVDGRRADAAVDAGARSLDLLQRRRTDRLSQSGTPARGSHERR